MPEPVKRGPGRPRKDGTPAQPKRARPVEDEPQPCEVCFPGGWDSLGKDAYTAGCPHGVAAREIPA